jgi:glycerol-1-phosphate dehydrogenase [NAD(P)+]
MACGMAHRVAIDEVAVAPDAVGRLTAYAGSRRWRRALLVMDANTEEAAGSRIAADLEGAGVGVGSRRFGGRSGLAADEDAVAATRKALRRDEAAGVIAVGSGVITDITRYAAHLEDRDFVSVPTAASMDGYASSVAAIEVGGVKMTFPARAPRAIFADPAVIAAAPGEMARSGLGDLLGKASARTDWLAAHLLYGERFCSAVDARVLAPLAHAADHAGAVLRREQSAIERLLVGLIQSGIAMAMVGSSRPASGCEHHASHFWDLLAARGLRRHAAHGLQVGYATRFAIRLQRFAFGGGVPALAAPLPPERSAVRTRRWLGEPRPELAAAVEEKRQFIASGAGRWPGQARWEEVRSRLEGALQPFAAVERALEEARIPAEPGFLGIDAATLRATFRYSNRLRARYTTVDFLEGQGALEEGLDAALPG